MFEDIEQQLRNSARRTFPPSVEFQAQLKMRLLEQREQIRNKPAFSWISWKIFVPAGAMLAVLVFMVVPQFTVEEIQESESPEAAEIEEPKPLFVPKTVTRKQPAVQTAVEQPVQDLAQQPMMPETFLKIGVPEEPGEFEAEEESEGEAAGFAESESASSAAMMAPQSAVTKPLLSLRREYADIEGNPDLTVNSPIIIRIFPSADMPAGNGTFEVTDILPAGFLVDLDHAPLQPIRIAGDRVTFIIPFSYFEELKQGRALPLTYFARTQVLGSYTVESAEIRSLEDPGWQGFSASLQVEVK